MNKYIITARDEYGMRYMDSEYGLRKAKILLAKVQKSYRDCVVKMRVC